MERGTLVGGKYRLTRPLAEGGMGSVWVAEHTELGVDIAVKFIAEDDPSPEAYARFRREAKVAAQLRSQHVVQVLDYGVVEARPYIAMELLQGEDLKRRLDRKGSLSLAETAQIVEQLSRAVDDAHASGLIHRDIKPRNVFLARYTRGEVVKLLDFGIAKDRTVAVSERTGTGVMLGSPHYMSPEQARGREITPQSDIWSLGVVTFELLLGQRPFPGDVLGDVIVNVCSGEIPLLADRSDLPPALDGVLGRALEREPARRFPRATDFAAALREIAAAHPAAHHEVAVGDGASLGRDGATEAATSNDALSHTPFGRDEETAYDSGNPPMFPASDVAVDLSGSLTASAQDLPLHQPRARRWGIALAGALLLVAAGASLAFVGDRPEEDEQAAVATGKIPSAPPPPAASASTSAMVVAPTETSSASDSPIPRSLPSPPGQVRSPRPRPVVVPRSVRRPPPTKRAAPPPPPRVDETFGVPFQAPPKKD